MKNALFEFKQLSGMTFEEIAKKSGLSDKSVSYRHCMGQTRIAPESAIKYHRAFGIPLCDLRPDLWPPEEVREKEPV